MTVTPTFSIKNKIILAIILILTLTTSFNLIYSYFIFKNDKEAYIYESALRSSEVSADKLISRIKSAITIVKSTDFTTKNHQADDAILFSGNLIGKSELNSYYIKKGFGLSKFKKHILKNSSVFNQKLTLTAYESFLILALKNKTTFRILTIDTKDFFAQLKSDNIFKYIVTDSENRVLFGNSSIAALISNSLPKDTTKGSQLIKGPKDNYLIAYTKYDNYKLRVYSYINSSTAFAVFKHIIYKNMLFATILFGVFLSLAVIFSRKITGPILKVIEKTQQIAGGDLSGEVEVTTNDELRTLGHSINTMSSKIKTLLDEKQEMIIQLEKANKQLDEYNKNLEKTVNERTKELKSANSFITAMINSLDQGLFSFDITNKCLGIFTHACEKMFGKSPKDLSVPELLGLEDPDVFTKWSKIVFENRLPFDSAKGLGPKSFQKGQYGDDNFTHIDLEYYPMNNEADELENIVVVATDNTKQIEALEKFKEKDAYVSMILEVFKDKKSFNSHLEECNSMLETLVQELTTQKGEELQNSAMIVFHTLNGGFASFSVYPLHKLAQASEQRIKSFKGTEESFKSLVGELITDFRIEQDLVLDGLKENLESSREIIEFKTSEIESLRSDFYKFGNEGEQLFDEVFSKRPVSELFDGYFELVDSLSDQLDKPMSPIFVEGGNIRVDTQKYKEFSSSLVHLFRNCMDHGIEDRETRKKNGKKVVGKISIEVTENQGYLHLSFSDDGNGIDLEKIKEKLKELDPGVDLNSLSSKELMLSIFMPNFTTKDKVSNLSGRGIGMSAIKKAIDNLDGRISVDSLSGRGSTFTFSLPQF